MTRVRYYCAATLDGFIADDDHGIDWLTGYEGSFEGEAAEATPTADAGLLDELIVTVVPVVLGSGRPLFERGLRAANLELTGTTTFRSGMVELRYEVRRS